MRKTLLAISLALIGTICSAESVGIFPENVQSICEHYFANFHGEMGEDYEATAEDLPCFRAQIQYLSSQLPIAFKNAQAAAKNKRKFQQEYGWMASPDSVYDQNSDYSNELLFLRAELTYQLVKLWTANLPKIKYPKSVVKICKEWDPETAEGRYWSDPCGREQTEYNEKQIAANLKKLMAKSDNPATLQAEQKQWQDGTHRFCAAITGARVYFQYYEACIHGLTELRSVELAKQVRELTKTQAKAKNK